MAWQDAPVVGKWSEAPVVGEEGPKPEGPSKTERFLRGQAGVGIGAAQTITEGARGAFPLLSRIIELGTTGKVGTMMNQPLAQYREQGADYEARRQAAGETGFDWMRMAGAASSPWNVLAGAAGRTGGGAGALRKVGAGITSGVVGGSMTPGSDSERLFAMGLGGGLGGTIASVPALTGKFAELVRPFTKKGAERKAGEILRKSALDADEAARVLDQPWPGVSQPTTGMASGDEGVASLMNTVQDKVPEIASAGRRAANNREAARSSFTRAVGGTADDLTRMQDARDAVTKPMRDAVLGSAKPIPASNIAEPIDKLLRLPEMAGKTNQTALSEVRSSLARITNPDGTINPVALYEIRKDINLMMDGKLSGEAANMKFARKALMAVKNAIDDQIDAASPQPGTWKAYLSEFAGRSKAVDQMAAFQDVVRRAGTGQVNPLTGEPVLSAATLNRILKNDGAKLAKELTREQMDALRRLAGDLSAEQMAASASRSATLNSVTNRQGNMGAALDLMLGRVPGGGFLTRLGQMVQGGNQERVMGLLGDAALDPNAASRLLRAGVPAPRNPNQGLLTGLLAASTGSTIPPLLIGVE